MIKLNIKSNDSLYDVLEEALTGLKEPITAAALMERPKVRASAIEQPLSIIERDEEVVLDFKQFTIIVRPK